MLIRLNFFIPTSCKGFLWREQLKYRSCENDCLIWISQCANVHVLCKRECSCWIIKQFEMTTLRFVITHRLYSLRLFAWYIYAVWGILRIKINFQKSDNEMSLEMIVIECWIHFFPAVLMTWQMMDFANLSQFRFHLYKNLQEYFFRFGS